MPNYFPAIEDEFRELEAQRRRLMSSDARLGVTSDARGRITLPTEQDGARLYALVYDLSRHAKKYPWMQPLATKALAQYGIDPDSAKGRAIAEIGAKVKMDSGLYFYDAGKAIKASHAGLKHPEQIAHGEQLLEDSARGALSIAEQGLGTAYVGADASYQYLRDTENNRYVKQTGYNSLAYEFSEGESYPVTGKKLSEPKGGGGGPMGRSSQQLSQANVLGNVTPVLRAGFMVLDAPLQELQGAFRNAASGQALTNPGDFESQSDLGISLGKLSRGEDVDVGSGIFVDRESEVSKERIRRAMEHGNIGGRTITPGRWAANLVFEPGSKPFSLLSGLTDLSVAVVGDPSNIALGGVGKVRQASKLFTEAGGIMGLRKTVSPAAVTKWVDGKDGEKVIQWLADHNDFYDIHKGLKEKAPVELSRQLADARTTDEVKDLLRPHLGTSLYQKPTVPTGAFSLQAVQGHPQKRLWGIMPGQSVDLDDSMDAVRQVERSLRNAHAPDTMIYEYTDKMARATNKFQRYKVFEDMWGGTKGMFVEQFGMEPPVARQLTKMFTDSQEDTFLSLVDDMGNATKPWQDVKAVINGAPVQLSASDPFLLVQHIQRTLTLPDARAIRRMTSKFRPILATKEGALRPPASSLEAFQQQVWKPMVLLRGAWTVRVIAEEQLRMAATGLDSMFRHPMSAIAWVVGNKKDVTFGGESLSDTMEATKTLTRGSANLLGPSNRMATGQWRVIHKSPETLPDFRRGWAEELAELHADPIAQAVAKFDNLDDAKAWFKGVAGGDARGPALRKELIEMGHSDLANDAAADKYIEIISDWVSTKTGGNDQLLDVIRTGKLGDAAIDLTATGQLRLNNDFVQSLDGFMDISPEAVKGTTYRLVDDPHGWWKKSTEFLFGALMSWPTNYLSRSPAFKQFYWNHAPNLMPFMTIDAQQALIATAKEAGIGGDLLRAISKARKETGELTLEQADFLSRGHALDQTKGLLYDMSERSRFFDATRLLFPFGEAWKEILTRWATIAKNRPQVIRRFQQGVQGAREPGFGELLGGAPGLGFWHENTQGEEVFTYPGSEWLTSKMMGVPVPLTGRVQGLNLVAEVFPALGPMASIPAGFFLPDQPEWDDISEIVFPFGRPEGTLGGALEYKTWMPSWMQKIFTPESRGNDPDSMRMWANTTMDVAKYLSSTGNYDTSTPEGIQKLLADAKSKATKFYLIRGLAQFVAPSSPAPEWLVNTETNGLQSAAMLAQEFRFLQEADYETAAQEFLTKYGDDPFMVMQSKSHPVVYGYPVTEDGIDWLRSNPDIQSNLAIQNVYGFFAPQGGEFSYPAYLRAIKDGAKQPLTPEQFVKLSNARLASIQYGQAVDELDAANAGRPLTDEQRAWKRQIKDMLIREYPGYGELLDGGLGLKERAGKDQSIRELYAAVQIPKLAETRTGQALTAYLQARDWAVAEAESQGLATFRSAKSVRYVRDYLREIGGILSSEAPEFAPLWDMILEREMSDDLEDFG